jgi:capsular exopolysaccharide synthesis family protein
MKELSTLVKQKAQEVTIEKTIEAAPPPATYRYVVAEPEPEEGFYGRLHEYWNSARRHFWLILGIMVLVATLAAVYTARQPDVYEAVAKVQVDAEVINPSASAYRANVLQLSTNYTDPIYFNTQLQLLTSAGLLGRVVKTLDLENNQDFLRPVAVQNRSTWESLRKMFGFSSKEQAANKTEIVDKVPLSNPLAPATSRDDLAEVNRLAPLVGMLQGGLSAKQVQDTRIIEIRYRHLDPQVAAKIVNAVAETYRITNLERKIETGENSSDFLQKRIADLQLEIRNGEERLNNYAKANQITSLNDNQNTVLERLAALNRQLLDAEKERIEAEAALRSSQSPDAVQAKADENSQRQVDTLETELAKLKQKRAELLTEYTEKYPEVVATNQQIAELEKQIREINARKVKSVSTNLKTRYDETKRKEDELRSAFIKQRDEVLKQNEAAVNYKLLDQEVENKRKLLDSLLQRAKENEVVIAGTPNNIRVVDYAALPKGPIGPRRFQTIALAILISLVFGIALSRYLDYLDDSVGSADDVERYLRLPALAVIPALGSMERRRGLRLLKSPMTALQKRNGNGAKASELLVDSGARSRLAEAYRQLRTSVLLSSAGGAPKTLLVTSSQPSEGKTTTVVNTATSLAQTGAKILVVDADMRRPRVHSILETSNRIGLSSILSSKANEQEIMEIIEYHEGSGLYVLPAGPIPPNPAELIGSEQMRKLLDLTTSVFTHVIIDSPPIASFTDGVLIASMVDGVLLVVHGGKASRNVVRRSKQVLQDVGAKIFGVVLNNVNIATTDYYYKYYYNDYKYYSKEDEG